MKNSFFKTILVLFVTAAMISSAAITSFALPMNTDVTDNYTYDWYAQAISAPVAYKPVSVLSASDLGISANFEPVDVFSRNGKLYIVDKGNSQILILNEQYQVIKTIKTLTGSADYTIPDLYKWVIDSNGDAQADSTMSAYNKRTLNKPEGIYVDKNDVIYIADTENRRIVVCNEDGIVSKVYQGVDVKVIDNYIFKPLKITVDRTGSMQVIAYSVNRGLLQLDSDGVFRSFFGAPAVSFNAVDWFWRLVASDEQKKKMIRNVPTEFSNITIDSKGFIYATISTVDGAKMYSDLWTDDGVSGATAPIQKLSPSGTDVLRRNGKFSPVGDLYFIYTECPQIVDVTIDEESGRYTILDARKGRFFTYDGDGNLLYMGGGSSTNQFGRIKSAASITSFGNQMVISDTGNDTLTIYETTKYATAINEAVTASALGRFEEAIGKWQSVLEYNSALYIAYVGLGKAEMRIAMASTDESRFDNYQKALDYFILANEKDNYSKTFKELRKETLSKNFNLLVTVFFLIIAGCFALYFANKHKKKKMKKEGGAR